MNEKNLTEFKRSCQNYFSSLSRSSLCCYGRSLQLEAPTKMKKADLIESIIAVLCGEITPKRSKKGAPLKSNYVDQSILDTVKYLQKEYLDKLSTNNDEICGKHLSSSIDGETKKMFSQMSYTGENFSLQFSIPFSDLNKNQKRLLINFLESL